MTGKVYTIKENFGQISKKKSVFLHSIEKNLGKHEALIVEPLNPSPTLQFNPT